MNFMKPKQAELQPPQKNPLSIIQSAFINLQTHCSSFLQHQNPLSIFTPKPNFTKPTHAGGLWAKIPAPKGAGMGVEAIEERLAGVPVYALSNASQEFVLVSGENSSKSLGLFCFKEEDANTLLQQMQIMEPGMTTASKVVAVPLNKVFQLKLDGVAFRLIPDSSQIKHALKEKQKTNSSCESFSGVPVFQSRSLVLKSQNQRYRPVFFRKEDLEKSLLRASRQQKSLNPAFREGDIQVAVLEDIIRGMKDSSTSSWDDVVFIPPGFDVSADPSQQ